MSLTAFSASVVHCMSFALLPCPCYLPRIVVPCLSIDLRLSLPAVCCISTSSITSRDSSSRFLLLCTATLQQQHLLLLLFFDASIPQCSTAATKEEVTEDVCLMFQSPQSTQGRRLYDIQCATTSSNKNPISNSSTPRTGKGNKVEGKLLSVFPLSSSIFLFTSNELFLLLHLLSPMSCCCSANRLSGPPSCLCLLDGPRES